MNRTYLIGPEVIMALFIALVFLFCARHYSYNSRDVDILERLMWLLPVMAVPLAYATFLVPGAHSWWWLGRVNVALFVALLVCGNKVVNGFVAPGGGPSAGAYGIFAMLCFGLVFAALANAIVGALILAELKPGLNEWLRAHKFLGGLLTVLAAIPIGAAMAGVFGLMIGVHVFFITLFKR